MTDYPDDADGQVLEQIAASGVDMSQPLAFEFTIDVADEASANDTKAALESAGYQATVEFDEGEPDEEGEIDPDDEEFGPAWTVYVGVKMVPDYNDLMRVQSEVREVVEPLGGILDGWGVMLGG